MTNEQINIAIAETCPAIVGLGADGIYYLKTGLVEFDPCNDLNAMHEVESVLSQTHNPCTGESQWSSFLSWLGFCGENNTTEVFQCVHATAKQRAEAFLRTIGKWKEGK